MPEARGPTHEPGGRAGVELEDFIGARDREKSGDGGIRRRLERVVARVGDHRAVRALRSVLETADKAGGALLVAGLAFHALFAMLPALLLLASASGFIFEDPARRAALIADLVRRFPPIADFVADYVQVIVNERSTLSIVALVGLVWGASNFYGSLDEAMLRIFSRGAPRSLIERRLRGMLGVLVLLGAAVGSVIAGSAWQVIEGTLGIGEDAAVVRVISPLVTITLMTIAVLLVYRIVPTAPPSWRAALPPAIVAGVAIASLTLLFSAVSGLLVRGLHAFGALTALFAALIWLNYVFYVLILGAAWARHRKLQEIERAEADANGPAPADADAERPGAG